MTPSMTRVKASLVLARCPNGIELAQPRHLILLVGHGGASRRRRPAEQPQEPAIRSVTLPAAVTRHFVLIVEGELECAPAKPDSIRGVSQPARDPGTRLAFNRFVAVPTVSALASTSPKKVRSGVI